MACPATEVLDALNPCGPSLEMFSQFLCKQLESSVLSANLLEEAQSENWRFMYTVGDEHILNLSGGAHLLKGLIFCHTR